MSEGDTKPVKVGQVKAGNHIIHNGDVYLVKNVEKSKAGKHGHAKARLSVENIITGNKKSLVMPGDDKVKSPIINKKIAQVLAVNPDSVQLMDQETYDTFETAIPNYKEIGGTLDSGDLVDLWEFMGRKVIKRKRSAD